MQIVNTKPECWGLRLNGMRLLLDQCCMDVLYAMVNDKRNRFSAWMVMVFYSQSVGRSVDWSVDWIDQKLVTLKTMLFSVTTKTITKPWLFSILECDQSKCICCCKHCIDLTDQLSSACRKCRYKCDLWFSAKHVNCLVHFTMSTSGMAYKWKHVLLLHAPDTHPRGARFGSQSHDQCWRNPHSPRACLNWPKWCTVRTWAPLASFDFFFRPLAGQFIFTIGTKTQHTRCERYTKRRTDSLSHTLGYNKHYMYV